MFWFAEFKMQTKWNEDVPCATPPLSKGGSSLVSRSLEVLVQATPNLQHPCVCVCVCVCCVV